MKLRIKGNSIRLRIARSELERLLRRERIVEELYLAPGSEGVFRYVLAVAEQVDAVSVTYQDGLLNVRVSPERLLIWNREEEVGIYSSLQTGHESLLEVLIEKDFACLDRSDEDNVDTFANPLAGTTC